MKDQFRILLKGDIDSDNQLGLFNRTFGTGFSEEQWQEKHEGNPYAGTTENVAAYEGDKLAGYAMYMPHEYYIGDRLVRCTMGCEHLIDSRYRGQGLLSRILRESEGLLRDRYEVNFGMPNEKSYRSLVKAGYSVKAAFNMYMKVNVGVRFIKDGFNKAFHHRSKENKAAAIAGRLDRGIAMSKGLHFSDEFTSDRVFNGPMNRIQINRDNRLYRWKVDGNSSRIMRYIYTEDEAGIRTMCVASMKDCGTISEIEIVDFYGRENVRGDDSTDLDGSIADLRLILGAMRKAATTIKWIAVKGGRNERLLKALGFRLYREEFEHLLYKVLNGDKKLEEEMKKLDWEFMAIETDTIFN